MFWYFLCFPLRVYDSKDRLGGDVFLVRVLHFEVYDLPVDNVLKREVIYQRSRESMVGQREIFFLQ